jgi:hypothetical protein
MAIRKVRKHPALVARNAHTKRQQRALLASRLAPEEEQMPLGHRPASDLPAADVPADPADRDFVDGSLIFDGKHFDLPRQLASTEDAGERGPWLNPVMIVVLTTTLGFTAFIAYLISIRSSGPV